MSSNSKFDPIRNRYYGPIELAEVAESALFVIAVVASFATLFVEKSSYPEHYNSVHEVFVMSVISLLIIGLCIRLYLVPRAQKVRSNDLFANSFSATTAAPGTSGYYNNNQTEPFRRLAANVFESSFFSKEIAFAMLPRVRTLTGCYLAAWFIAATYQKWDIALIAVGAQAVFSEQIISRWLRLEWSAVRFEQSFTELSEFFESIPTDEMLVRRRILEKVYFYESSKSTASITLSSRAFQKMNDSLNARWEEVRSRLRI